MIFRRKYGLLAAGAAAALAAVAAVSVLLTAGSSGSGPATFRLSSAPLGVNVAPWDGLYTGASGATIQSLLRAAGIGQLRYGGGSYADYYDWQTNTDIGKCLPGDPAASFTSRCATTDPLGFAQFSRQARMLGADSFVTVNYGSGTPAMAAAWVTQALHAPGQRVALWEVGNETYGCWEVDNELAGPPANYHGYIPAAGNAAGQYQNCPLTTQGAAAGMKTLATSYADNALRFLRAMKTADPAAKIGVPWVFSGYAQGGTLPDGDVWNKTVLGKDGAYAGFVDAHYYPFSFSGGTGGGNPSDAQVLRSLTRIPLLAASVHAGLAAHDPGAGLVIGETAVSSAPTSTVCTPAGAVFAAGDVLSWLAAGARSVDWWDMNNYGNTGTSCTNPDYGLFTSAAQPVAQTPYYGYLLASALARPGALLGFLKTSDPGTVLGYQSALPGGKHAVAFLNLDTAAPHTVTFAVPAGFSGTLRSQAYSAGKQNPANSEIVTGTTSAAAASNGITLAPESITVLETR